MTTIHTKSGCSSNTRKYVAIIVAAPPAIAAWTLIIGESGCHFKPLSAVAREGKGLCVRHMVALWSEQDVPAWRCVHVVYKRKWGGRLPSAVYKTGLDDSCMHACIGGVLE